MRSKLLVGLAYALTFGVAYDLGYRHGWKWRGIVDKLDNLAVSLAQYEFRAKMALNAQYGKHEQQPCKRHWWQFR